MNPSPGVGNWPTCESILCEISWRIHQNPVNLTTKPFHRVLGRSPWPGALCNQLDLTKANYAVLFPQQDIVVWSGQKRTQSTLFLNILDVVLVGWPKSRIFGQVTTSLSLLNTLRLAFVGLVPDDLKSKANRCVLYNADCAVVGGMTFAKVLCESWRHDRPVILFDIINIFFSESTRGHLVRTLWKPLQCHCHLQCHCYLYCSVTVTCSVTATCTVVSLSLAVSLLLVL